MRLLAKEIADNGRVRWYFCGFRNFSYKSEKNIAGKTVMNHLDLIGTEIYQSQQNEFSKNDFEDMISKLDVHPLISIIMPIYNPPVEWLEIAIKSLQTQYYSNWELCAVDDGSKDGQGAFLIEKMAKADSRIRLFRADKNEGISTASNISLKMARGEFIALIDQDDEIPRDALFWFVMEINQYPDADFIYSDECKIAGDFSGRLSDFLFKPDWSPTLLLNHMYTGHLTVYSTELVRKVNGFRKEYDFSQDYDLALRISDVAKNIRHIERVLYLWRRSPTSGAEGGKAFAKISNICATHDWFKRKIIDVVMGLCYGSINHGFVIRKENPKVSIIIPSDSHENLSKCIVDLTTKTSYENIEIIPVTNTKVADELLEKFPYVGCLKICYYNKVFNFSDKCNEGAKISTGSILCFYNDDVSPHTADWIERQIELLEHPGVGAVSPMLVNEDMTIQYAGMITGTPGLVGTSFNGRPFTQPFNSFNHFMMRDVSVLSGACTVMPKALFFKIGGFDEINTPSGHSDVVLSFKILNMGLRCVYTPYSILTHIGNHSWHSTVSQDKKDIYYLKYWGKYVAKDPYFTKSMRKCLYHDFSYKYEIHTPQNIFLPNNQATKDILFISHELSLTGAPIVLLDMIKIAIKNNFFPVVLAIIDGPLRQVYLDLGVTVIIDESSLNNHWMFERFARHFDLVVVNTLACSNAVNLLSDSLPPVLWWVHEGSFAMKHFIHLISDSFGKNIHAFSVSDYTEKIMKESGLKIKFEKLTIGVPRISGKMKTVFNEEEIIFGVVGTIEKRKGQDLILQVNENLEVRYRKRAKFIFVGNINMLDGNDKYEVVLKAEEKFRNVQYIKPVPREDVYTLYQKFDCLLVPSRDEPMSMVAAEAMSLEIPVICSDHTGISSYIKNYENGIIFTSESIDELTSCIKFAMDNREKLVQIGKQGFQIYKDNFTMEKFENRILQIFNNLLERNNKLNI